MSETMVEKLKNEVSTLTLGAELISVTTREEYEVVCRQEDAAAGLKAQVEEYWADPIKKAFDLHRSLTAKRRELVDPLEAFIKVCKRAAGNYLALEERKAKEQAAALEKQAKEMNLDTSLIPAASTAPKAGPGRALVKTWDFEIVDVEQIPRKYLIPNEKAIRAEVVALGDKAQIPGIRIFQNSDVRRTGK